LARRVTLVFLACVGVGLGVASVGSEAQAQRRLRVRPADAIGVARALADSMPRGLVRVLVGETDDTLSRALAGVLGVPFASRDSGTSKLPACPWGSPVNTAWEPGYQAIVRRIESPSGAAVSRRLRMAVTVLCDNPPGFTHDTYLLGQEYIVGRVRGRWRIVGLGGIRVT
jgi:hypothetical protein